MIKNFFLLIVLLSSVEGLIAQEPFYKSYSWEQHPDYGDLATNDEEDMIAFKDKLIKEFYFNDDNNLVEFSLEHQLLWLNSNSAIEDNNKVYLPFSSNSEILISKARVITNKGEIIELDDSKILTATDEETNKVYKYYAFEGIEKGSFIEYYYVVKKNPQYKGRRIYIQDAYNKANVSFELFAPENLVFKFKSYNELEEVKKDTMTKGKLHWKLNIDQIEKLEKEEQSAYDAYRKYLVYKLDKNTANNSQGISSYVNVSKNMYRYLFVDLSSNEISSIQKLVKASGLNKEKNEEFKIRALENYLKSNFYIADIETEAYEDINSILENKTGNEVGLIRIMIAALKSVGIKTEVVLTSDRFDLKFDKTFQASNFLTDYLLYFPGVKMYTSPKEIDSRLGIPPSELTDNYGLFIKEVQLGNYTGGAGKVRYIEPLSAEKSGDEMIIDVSFDKSDLTINHIKLNRTYSGYYASYIQPYLNLINKEDVDKFYDQLIKSLSENLTIIDKTVKNDNSDLFGKAPFNLTAHTETESMVVKAGNKYLFKLGEIIGPQMEMYQETERKLPIESQFNRNFIRTLNIKIPKGFTINNPDEMNIHHFHMENGEKIHEFHSYYTINQDVLTVYANEFYKQNHIALENYEAYRKVVNGAADFNKIVLVLEPE